jgi:hypothetical protein
MVAAGFQETTNKHNHNNNSSSSNHHNSHNFNTNEKTNNSSIPTTDYSAISALGPVSADFGDQKPWPNCAIVTTMSARQTAKREGRSEYTTFLHSQTRQFALMRKKFAH